MDNLKKLKKVKEAENLIRSAWLSTNDKDPNSTIVETSLKEALSAIDKAARDLDWLLGVQERMEEAKQEAREMKNEMKNDNNGDGL